MNISELLEIAEPLIEFSKGYLLVAWEIVKKWYWVALPFILWKPALFYWLWWRQELWDNKQKSVLLEIKVPRDNPKPMRAMEAVFSGIWQMHTPPSPIEEWWDGQQLQSYSFEVAAIDGVPHYLIRTPKSAQSMVESHIYSQFPEAEISEIDDYTKKVPQDIPNKEWDMWATDCRMRDPDPYPIKTYTEFETERESKEEKRIDPMSSLLEGMSKLRRGEQVWLQIRAKPILDSDIPWKGEGRKIINKLVHRDEPKKNSFLVELIQEIINGPTPPKEKPKETLPPEMKLTPGERDIVSAIERKISKLGYEVFVRYIYLAKKEVFFKPNSRIAMSYFTNFVSESLNGIVPNGKTMTKVRRKWQDTFWFPKRRLYLRKRRSFRKYIKRVPYYYPQPGGTFILNTEELATIFHFPSKTLTPASLLPRIQAKKGEAPPELPIEDREKE